MEYYICSVFDKTSKSCVSSPVLLHGFGEVIRYFYDIYNLDCDTHFKNYPKDFCFVISGFFKDDLQFYSLKGNGFYPSFEFSCIDSLINSVRSKYGQDFVFKGSEELFHFLCENGYLSKVLCDDFHTINHGPSRSVFGIIGDFFNGFIHIKK